jgi:hypothetical protein
MDSLYGLGAGSNIPALSIYQRISQTDEATAAAKYGATPAVANEITYVKQQIAQMKSPDDLYSNYRVMKFVLSAFGLDSQIGNTGLIKQVTQSDLTDTNSLANALKDPRFKQLATALNIQATGISTLQQSSTLDSITSAYITNQYEQSFDSQNPAVHQALYFLRNIQSASSNVYSVLGDPTLSKVVETVLGLPDSIAVQPVESQAALITNRLDLSQFTATGATNIGGPSATQQADAQTDLTGLTKILAAGDAAANAASTIGSRLAAVKAEYDNLAKVQDPNGVNAQEIPVQAAAEPQILRQQGLISAAQSGIEQAAQDLNRMSQLRALAADPANASSLADYQKEFASLATDIHSAIGGSTYRTNGVDESLLNGSLSQPITVQIDSAGHSVTVHPQDVSGFLTQVDNAAASFAAVTGASDTTDLSATQSAISTGGPTLGAARDAVAADATALSNGLATVPMWAANVNSSAIAQGAASISDAQSRTQQIQDTVTQIRALAAESVARDPSADRSDLTSQFTSLVSTLGSLTGTAGAGADNLLNGTDKSYAFGDTTTLSASGRDLNASVVNPLSSGDLSSVAGAQAVLDQIDGTITSTLDNTQRQLTLDAASFQEAGTVFDARGKADADFRQLGSDMQGLMSSAASNGVNLLGPSQSDLTTFSQLQLHSIDMTAQTGFISQVADVVNQALSQLPNNLNGSGGAYQLLQTAMFNANEAASSFESSRQQARDGITQAQTIIQQAQQQSSTQTTGPNDFTKRFVMRFLALSDASDAASAMGVDASSSSNVNVQLLGSIGGSTDLLA